MERKSPAIVGGEPSPEARARERIKSYKAKRILEQQARVPSQQAFEALVHFPIDLQLPNRRWRTAQGGTVPFRDPRRQCLPGIGRPCRATASSGSRSQFIWRPSSRSGPLPRPGPTGTRGDRPSPHAHSMPPGPAWPRPRLAPHRLQVSLEEKGYSGHAGRGVSGSDQMLAQAQVPGRFPPSHPRQPSGPLSAPEAPFLAASGVAPSPLVPALPHQGLLCKSTRRRWT